MKLISGAFKLGVVAAAAGKFVAGRSSAGVTPGDRDPTGGSL